MASSDLPVSHESTINPTRATGHSNCIEFWRRQPLDLDTERIFEPSKISLEVVRVTHNSCERTHKELSKSDNVRFDSNMDLETFDMTFQIVTRLEELDDQLSVRVNILTV